MAEGAVQLHNRGVFFNNRAKVHYNQRSGLPLVLPILKIDIVIPCSSSSTPTVPYSTADILYSNDVHGGSRNGPGDDLRQSTCTDTERSNKDVARQKVKELEQHPNNRRPSSKTGKQRSISIDSGKKNHTYFFTYLVLLYC